MMITKVTGMSYLRPFVGQLLGYGTLRVESAGQKQDLETIKCLPRPEEVFMAVSELVFGDKKQSRPICCNHLDLPAAVAAGLAGDPMTKA
jgi:hypothetical protein